MEDVTNPTTPSITRRRKPPFLGRMLGSTYLSLSRPNHALRRSGSVSPPHESLAPPPRRDDQRSRPLPRAGRARSGRALLTRLALVVHRLGDPGSEQLFAEARALLEKQHPGPELVNARRATAQHLVLLGRARALGGRPARRPWLRAWRLGAARAARRVPRCAPTV